MKQQAETRIVQYAVRIFVLGLATYLAVLHQLKGVLAAPNAHVFCPFGGLESLYKFAAAGGYVPKIMSATLVLFLASVILVLVLNRAFCGWICPLGTLQMLFDRLARLLKIKKIQVPQKVETVLQYVKYVGLVVIIYYTWKIGDLVYSPYDPWATYGHLAAGWEEIYAEFLIGAIFLLVALIGSFWLPNNFCRYFCPMGAFLGILSKISPTRIYRNETICINCKKCDRVCPSQIVISPTPNVNSAECLSCGDCIAACPVENTLFYSIRGKLTIKWLVYGIVAVILFFAPVYIAKALRIWKTSYSSAEEVLMDDTGVKNPMNIKGSMTLRTVADEFNVPLDAFFKKFNLPAETNPDDMLKNIAHPLNMEAEEFRNFIIEYLEKGDAALEGVEPSEAQPTTEEPAAAPEPTSTPAPAETQPTLNIIGKTTLRELRQYGLTNEQFKEITGVDMPDDAALTIRDFAEQHGLDREAIKDKFIEILQR